MIKCIGGPTVQNSNKEVINQLKMLNFCTLPSKSLSETGRIRENAVQ